MIFLVLRFLLAFAPTYIHPDEHLQNPEVAVSFLGHIHPELTWEWELPHPVRSIAPVYLTTGWSFYIVDTAAVILTGKPASGRVLFVTGRLVFFLLSLTLDYAVQQLAARKRVGSWLVQTSGLVLTLILHTFSNSIEASLVGLCLVLLKRIDRSFSGGDLAPPHRLLFSLATLLALGIWTRFTFVIFAFVVGVALVYSILRSYPKPVSLYSKKVLLDILHLLFPAIVGGIISIILLTLLDSLYYGKFVVTPFNAFNFNRLHAQDFGIRPFWLHVVAFIPELFLPFLFGFFYTVWHFPSCHDIVLQSSVAYIILLVFGLSTNPHQEARFLMSLLVPFVLLAASAVPHSPKLYTIGKMVVLFHAVGLVFVYSGIHQFGAIQASLEMNEHLQRRNDIISDKCSEGIDFVYWKVSWPPDYLLLSRSIPECEDAIKNINSLAYSSEEFLLELSKEERAPNRYVLTPLYHIANTQIQKALKDREITLVPIFDKKFGPFFDFDRLGEIYHAGYNLAWLGWYEVVSEKNIE